MTDGHKHRQVRMKSPHSVLVRLLRKPMWHVRGKERIESSQIPFAPCIKHAALYEKGLLYPTDCAVVTLLGILHRWTGLTLVWGDEK